MGIEVLTLKMAKPRIKKVKGGWLCGLPGQPFGCGPTPKVAYGYWWAWRYDR